MLKFIYFDEDFEFENVVYKAQKRYKITTALNSAYQNKKLTGAHLCCSAFVPHSTVPKNTKKTSTAPSKPVAVKEEVKEEVKEGL